MPVVTFLAVSLNTFFGLAQMTSAAPQKRSEVRRTFPLTKFYDTPSPLPAGKPGELIRSQEFDEYILPEGVNAFRILYHSRSASGEDVATSGVVLFPDGDAPRGGWPVLAWAHGEDGVARSCAPSLARNLQHGPFLAMYVNLGYAVVASDYTGLGTSFRHAFADMQSNATDVINSVPAARAAVPHLGTRWLAIGHEEGGTAVAEVAQLEQEIRDPNYLGGVVISGLEDLQDVYQRASTLDGNLGLFLAYGIETLYPHSAASDTLTGKALPLYRKIAAACGDSSAHTAAEMLKPDWERNPFASQYLSRNRVGEKRAYGPLLVISGAGAGNGTAKIVARLCNQGDQVQFDPYPGSDSGQVIGDSVTHQIAWIRARFAGEMAHSNCPGKQ
ncbi:MAG: hypothetical protein WB952_12635 [Terriglobales bacterium]